MCFQVISPISCSAYWVLALAYAKNILCSGLQAKRIFEQARLPIEVLERIWSLSDTQQAGALALPEFVVAMHLLTSYKNGAMRALPTVLPPSLFDAASRLVQQRVSANPTLSQAKIGSLNTATPRHVSGQGVQQPQSPLRSPSTVPAPLSTQSTGSDWAISATNKAQFDSIFSDLDKANRGYISGEEAVRFFGNSKLPAEVLAQIWDLACIQSNGQLNRDEFAVAMYLIRQQRIARDGGKTLPTTLPPNLVPPSIRRTSRPLAQPLMVGPAAAPVVSAADDLLGLDAPSQLTSTQADGTGGSASANFNVSKTRSPEPWIDQPGQPTQDSSVFRPFVPSSSWGQNMVASHSTGLSKTSERPRNESPLQSLTGPSSASDDLLSDNDPEISKKLTAETTELANLSNQIGSLSNKMQEVNSKKTSTENELSKVTTQKRDFEIRLAQLRSVYEQELGAVRSLEERLDVCRNENMKLLRDIAMVEATHEDLRLQQRQAVSALETDRQENAQLTEKIRTVNVEIEALKPQLEKIKSDARQTKGLVAINKKQLTASEGERDRLQSEVTEASKHHDGVWPGEDRGLTSSEVRDPAAEAEFSPTIASPSTNPFARFSPVHSPGPDVRDNTASPTQQHATTFDDLFGPSFHPQSVSPPPSTSFPLDRGLNIQSSRSANVPQPASASEKSYPSSSTTTIATATAQEAPSASKPPPSMPSPQGSARSLVQHSSANLAESVGRLPSASASGSFVDSMGVRSLDSSGTKSDIIEGGGLNPLLSRESENIDTSRSGPLVQDQSTMPRVDRVVGDESLHETLKSTESSSPSHGIFPSPPVRAPLPGAFPGEFNSPMVRTPVEERRIPSGIIHHQQENNSNTDEPIDTMPPTTVKGEISSGNDDFDAAFADFEAPNRQNQTQQQQQTTRTTNGMSKNKKNENNAAQVGKSDRQIDHEFPPIQELELDESDSSSSDHGFDDDFTSISPHQSGNKLDDGTVDHSSPHPSKAIKSPWVPTATTTTTTTGGSETNAPTSVSSALKESPLTEPMLVKSNSTAGDSSVIGSLPMTMLSNTASTTPLPFPSDGPTSQSAISPPTVSASSHRQSNKDIQPAAATSVPVPATTSQHIPEGGSFGDDDAFNEDDFKDLTDAQPEESSFAAAAAARDGKNVDRLPDFGYDTDVTSGIGAETGTGMVKGAGTGIRMGENRNGGGGGGNSLDKSPLLGEREEEITLGEDFDLAFDLSRPGVATTTTTDVVVLPPFTS